MERPTFTVKEVVRFIASVVHGSNILAEMGAVDAARHTVTAAVLAMVAAIEVQEGETLAPMDMEDAEDVAIAEYLSDAVHTEHAALMESLGFDAETLPCGHTHAEHEALRAERDAEAEDFRPGVYL